MSISTALLGKWLWQFAMETNAMWRVVIVNKNVMQEMQENYYLILFMFASQLYFYVLGPSSLLGY